MRAQGKTKPGENGASPTIRELQPAIGHIYMGKDTLVSDIAMGQQGHDRAQVGQSSVFRHPRRSRFRPAPTGIWATQSAKGTSLCVERP